jgi:prolyl-tRNA synthetase
MLLPTLRENPKDAEIDSHVLMLRAGLLRKMGAGLYTFLPLGFKSLLKVTAIVRDEMNRAGAQEMLPPILTPADLWRESGRFDVMGKEMMRLKDRHEADLVLGPTHEEAFTAAVRENVHSYRDLPLTLYQINTKFRDEIRPRFGIMRCREFIMMDAYSFHLDETDLDQIYQEVGQAYRRIFKRCGLNVTPVLADSGAMGGSVSEEFMVPSTVGEDTIFQCASCGYVANAERAVSYEEYKRDFAPLREKEETATPNVRTIDELAAFFKTTPDRFIKSLVYKAEGKPVMAVIRGDLEINETKLKNVLKCAELELADEDTIKTVTGAPVGFASPVGLRNITVIADKSVEFIVNGITGANKKDTHIVNVNPERDFTSQIIADIRLTRDGDLCPECRKPLKSYKGIEVGHVFKLGYKYTESMHVSVLDKEGKEIRPIMGTYGIGVGRTLASVIEQNHDENGIIWPMSVAPYEIIVVIVNTQDEEAVKAAFGIYEDLSRKYEVLIDDRDERPGVKFKDADLIGIPIRITVGKSFKEEGKLELKERKKAEKEFVSLSDLTVKIGEIYDRLMANE